jgi:hypothetical protein
MIKRRLNGKNPFLSPEKWGNMLASPISTSFLSGTYKITSKEGARRGKKVPSKKPLTIVSFIFGWGKNKFFL